MADTLFGDSSPWVPEAVGMLGAGSAVTSGEVVPG